jgi:hypothetical protein
MRYALVIVAALGMSGCQGNQAATYNPFAPAGPALMPPPPTGTAGRPDPYNTRPAAPTGAPGYAPAPGYTPAPGSPTAPGYAAPPAGAAPYTPPPTMGSPLGYAAPPAASPYARFTSQDAGNAVEVADSRAGYVAPAGTPPAQVGSAPATTGVMSPPPAFPGQPAPLSPYVTGTANQLSPVPPPANPAWSGNY